MTDPKTPATPFASPEETAAFVEEQVKEYGTYVAISPITFNGIPAYNVGDPVPVSNVERHGYLKDGLVAKTDSKVGQDMVRAIHESIQQAAEQQPVAVPVSLGVPLKDLK